ncbi:M14 family zinc carboxypeptidase [Apibacter adventoris]|uniref:Peptidase M14 n=1 Tax=Apibacter adventoris TaxID=1679466 RepID=A0A2S8AEH4_9FLAO|nr:M14 family zinc carboxypeptidase [Apibacter adventoris]PQL93421.1 peptidase M14 [Apibacter adventoris]
MSTELKIVDLEQNLDVEEIFNNRYVNPKKLNDFLVKNYKENLTLLGYSVCKKPIFKLSIGVGKKNILLWTQMHGNETTGTLSVLDLLKFLKNENKLAKEIFEKFTLDIVLMLNPDGSEIWTRRNIMNIDVNRDFLAEASPEIRILKNLVKEKIYDLAFNLHDQRTIYGVGTTNHSATLSFLSPSVSEDREITEIRKQSMGIIASIYKEITKILPNKIARYSDEFYPRSVGDNFQKLGIPTLLFEGGHYPNDYYRQKTRKYFTLALITALHSALKDKSTWKDNYKDYLEIPENSVSFYDIIYRNVALSEDVKNTVDIAIQYSEFIFPEEEDISFVAKIEEIGDLSFLYGHKEINAEGRRFYSENNKYPKINMEADFQLDEWVIVNGNKLESIV